MRPDYANPAVRDGCLLRIAADLLVPFGELGAFDRYELVEHLSRLGIHPATAEHRGTFWIDGACPGPEPRDEMTVLRPDGDTWVIGYWERGSFRIDHRFGNERDACRWMLHDLLAHHTTSMGTSRVGPHVLDEFRHDLLAALAEVTELVARPG